MPRTDCPDRAALANYLNGRPDGGASATLEDHLSHCDECARVAETLTSPGDPSLVQDETRQRAIETLPSVETIIRADSAGNTLHPAFDPAEVDFLQPAEEPDEIGRLGGYRVLEVLGVGGMGVVFRAEDPKLKRQVAIKAMKPVVAASRSAKNRFLKEAEATAAIEHDHIVTIYQVGEDRGIPFIAMRYLRGESLQHRLSREGRLDEREVLRIGRQIALGLAAAHDHGLIHRDVKPDNVWLDSKQGRVKIVDFGLVRSVHDDSGLTQSGMVVGTPRYMAPEQAEGQPVDHRCDLFSLGSVLYHLVTGRPPFEGSSLTSTLLAVVRAEPDPIAMHRPETHPDLAALIGRLLSKSIDDRPATATEVAAGLAAIERQLDEGVTATYTAIEPRTDSAGGRRGLGRRMRLWAGAIGVLALVAAVVYVQTNRGRWRGDTQGDGVAVTTTDGGRSIKVTDTTTGTSVSATRDGNTTIASKGDRNEVTIDDDGFTVKRDGEEIANAQVRMMRASPDDPFARDRAAAELVLSGGGLVGVSPVDAPGRLFFGPGDALPDGSFALTLVTFGSQKQITAGDLGQFAGLDRLRAMELSGPWWLEGDLLQSFPHTFRIDYLSIVDTGVRTTDLAALQTMMPSCLTLEDEQVVDEWRFLATLPSLREVKVQGHRIPAIESLGRFDHLRILWLPEVPSVDPATVSRIQSDNPNLRILIGNGPSTRVLGDDPVVESVRILTAKNWLIAGEGFETRVEKQRMFGPTDPPPRYVWNVTIPAGASTSMDDRRRLVSLNRELRYLVAPAAVDADGLAESLAGYHLGVLQLVKADLTDAGLRSLAKLNGLMTLDIRGTAVTREGVDAFRWSRPYCTVFSDFGTFPADPSLGWAAEAKPVVVPTADAARDRAAAEWVLSVGGRIAVSNRTTGYRLVDSELPPGDFSLVLVDLYRHRDPFTAEDLRRLAGLERLNTGRFENSAIDAAGLAVLAEVSHLHHLAVQNTKLRSTDFAVLRSLDPCHLECDGRQVVDGWRFLESLPTLRELEIYGANFPDIEPLGNHRQLNRLNVQARTTLDPELVDRLQRANPRLRIVVGRPPEHRVVGRDPLAESLDELRERNWKFTGLTFDKRHWDSRQSPNVAPDVLTNVEIPPGTPLAEVDAERIRSLAHRFGGIFAAGCTGIDGLASGLTGTSISTLRVANSDLTDDGLRALAEIRHLAVLDVTGTRVTLPGIEAFRRARFYCDVTSDFGTFEPEHRLPEESPPPEKHSG